MAARFWVSGGTGNWSSTTNWSASSNGSSGASVPSTADTATFNSFSGSGTATVDSSVTIQTLTMTGFTGTLAFGTNTISLNTSGTFFTGDSTYSVTGTPLLISTYTGTVARTPSFGSVTEAKSISLTVNNGGGNFGVTGNLRSLVFSGSFSGVYRDAVNTFYGDLTFKTGMTIQFVTSSATRTFAGSGTQKITSAALNLDFPITFSGTGTYQLQDALTVGTRVRAITFTSGTIDLNGFTLTNFGNLSSNNTNTRSIIFGSTGSYVNITTASSSSLDFNATNFTSTGSKNCTFNNGSGSNTTTISFTNGNETNALNISFASGTGRIDLIGFFKNVNLSGFTGTCFNSTRTIYGNFTGSGITYTAGSNVTTFAATGGTQTITTGSSNLNFPITFSGTAIYQLQNNLFVGTSSSWPITLTSGTLDLNGFTLTHYGTFSSNNTNTRAIAFGTTGAYVNTLSTNATCWDLADLTNFTCTGTSNAQFTPGSFATITIAHGTSAGGSEAKAISFTFNSSFSATINFSISYILDLNVTDGSTYTYTTPTIYGSYNQNNQANFTSLTLASTNTSRQNTIASSGGSLPAIMNISGGVGVTYKLLNVNSSYLPTWNINSSIDTNGRNLFGSAFNFNNSNTKTITVSSGNYIELNNGFGGSGVFIGSMVGTTLNLTGSEVRFTSSGSFNVPDSTFPALRVIASRYSSNAIVTVGSSGNTQTITNIFESSDSPSYGVIALAINSTLNVVDMVYDNFSASAFVNGPLQTNYSSTQATLRKTSGTLIVNNRSIRDIVATGGATFRAPTNAPYSNIDNGNNSGWIFSPYSPSSGASNFFLLF